MNFILTLVLFGVVESASEELRLVGFDFATLHLNLPQQLIIAWRLPPSAAKHNFCSYSQS